MTELETLGEALAKECARVRELQGQYKVVGRPGAFAAEMMERALRRADEAMIENDIVAMLRAYQELTAFTD